MKPDFREKGMESDPRSSSIADSGTPMKFEMFEPGDLRDPRSAVEALAHWDELEPAARRTLTADPLQRSRLAMLEAVDGWMQRRVHDLPDEGQALGCPAADELYDFGRGPGYVPLTAMRAQAIERHVVSCADCGALAKSLAVPPPLPLVLGLGAELEPVIDHPLARSEPRRTQPVRSPAVRVQGWRRWAPLAAAASLLAIASVWLAIPRGTDAGFPVGPLLRGEAGGPLYFPRDRVLRPTATIASVWPALADDIRFEIEPQAEATEYRVDLFAHEGGAFSSTSPVESLMSREPLLAIAANKLALGHYTWRAWASVRGLDIELGERDFVVVDDAGLAGELARLADSAEPERSLAAVRLCADRGFSTDARRIARRLPASAERDLFLGRMPGR